MKLVILTAIWKRPEVFEYFKTFYKRVRKDMKDYLDIECVVVGSEGKASEALCIEDGMYYVECDNQPLCVKWSVGSMACEQLNPDYVLCMGSDDIFCTRLMDEYYKHIQQGYDYICLKDSYFFNVDDKKGVYWGGYTKSYNKGISAGVGRCISKRLATVWKWRFWDTGHDAVVDQGMEERLKMSPHTKKMVSCRELNMLCLDIKSKVNMTPLENWDNSAEADGKAILYEYLPKSEADKIYNHE